MDKVFTSEELEILKNYRFTLQREYAASDLSIVLEDLTKLATVTPYMNRLAQHIQSPSLKVTSSMFVKRVAFLAAIYLYSMTAFNKRIESCLEDIFMQTNENDPLWLPTFYFSNVRTIMPTESRKEWREQGVQHFFTTIISPIITVFVQDLKQSKHILWENIAIYIYWLYETVLASHEDDEVRLRSKEDFKYLVVEAPGSLFGSHDENPLKKFHHKKTYVEQLEEEVRVRSTCCFFYALTGTSDRCRICPQTCKTKSNKPMK